MSRSVESSMAVSVRFIVFVSRRGVDAAMGRRPSGSEFPRLPHLTSCHHNRDSYRGIGPRRNSLDNAASQYIHHFQRNTMPG